MSTWLAGNWQRIKKIAAEKKKNSRKVCGSEINAYLCTRNRKRTAIRYERVQRIRILKGSYQSGQMGQTVNLLAYAFGGSNPSLPTSTEVLRE